MASRPLTSPQAVAVVAAATSILQPPERRSPTCSSGFPYASQRNQFVRRGGGREGTVEGPEAGCATIALEMRRHLNRHGVAKALEPSDFVRVQPWTVGAAAVAMLVDMPAPPTVRNRQYP